ncbi:unnamed protein product [Blepharisma stoltei]|uniref:Uncharacterized protein n=1 Tax=Blepharisma stoltei TaxID=1481888 RepID=A0AAU9IQW2_9CILI|nr:unnamed protein product [Blepharisma stoltei]
MSWVKIYIFIVDYFNYNYYRKKCEQLIKITTIKSIKKILIKNRNLGSLGEELDKKVFIDTFRERTICA